MDGGSSPPSFGDRSIARRRRCILAGSGALIGTWALPVPVTRAALPQHADLRVDTAAASRLGDRVPEGLNAWLKAVPGRHLPVYGASPSIPLPADHPVPYPMPENGLQAITNHLRRYTGGGIERWGLAYPVRPRGDTYAVGLRSRRIYASHLDGAPAGLSFVAMLAYTAPASLRGQIVLVHEPIDFTTGRRSAWVYSAANRRVRRAPDLAYDAVSDGSEGLLTADQVDGYNGAPDRYDWRLIGRLPRIVPFGSSGLGEGSLALSDWKGSGSVQSRWLRFEERPVWVVEAVLRAGQSHIYPRRRFYIDPDCWTVLLEEAWSARGQIWRVAFHGVTALPGGQGPFTRYSMYHDLDAGSYFVSGFDDPSQPATRIGVRASMSEFTPDALRRIAAQF
jgi:hypothetical protein